MSRYGLIAGSGRFPVLALEEARKLGHDVVVVGIRGEAPAEVESLAATFNWGFHWVSVAQLGKLIDTLRKEKLTEVVFAGQVKHVNLFSGMIPDMRLAKLLMSMPSKNTDALIGGVIGELAKEGIAVMDSTALLKPLLAGEGAMTRRKPTSEEEKEIRYGRQIAASLSGFDVGQSVAIAARACVALEAMEGTDAMLRRAASLANGHRITLVKGSRRRHHLQFDVPVAGPSTIAAMRETNTTVLAVDAGRTLLLDREEMLVAADEAGISVVGHQPEDQPL